MTRLNKISLLIAFFVSLNILLVACEQPPDFTKPCPVIHKTISSKNISEYEIDYRCGTRGQGLGAVTFKAPPELANVGDTLVFVNNSIRVLKRN